MKKTVSLLLGILVCFTLAAQPEDPKVLHETGKTFMRSSDFNNAVIVLSRAQQIDPDNIEIQKDLAMSCYLKRDFAKALEVSKKLVDRPDADVVCFQIAGNVYKALEEFKDCEKMYKKGLKKFPKSGPLHSEYGELLWSAKDYSAIKIWEEGIKVDPAFSGNYYNAALYYFYTKDKVWSLIYGEIFVNMESLGERGAAMKQLLLQGYKEKLFSEPDLLKESENTKNAFAKSFLQGMAKQSTLVSRGVNTETLTMIRARFILDWYASNASKYPFRLFDYQRQLLSEGMFTAYNQWLFGPVENLTAYEDWSRKHREEYNAFSAFQKTRIFRMSPGQYYQEL